MRKGIIAIFLILMTLIVGCGDPEVEENEEIEIIDIKDEEIVEDNSVETNVISIKETKFITVDNIEISANYYTKEGNSKAAILVHMLNHNKESWNDFAGVLLGEGYDSIAIDLRGHGKSINNDKTWGKFDENEFIDMIFDVDAAFEFIKLRDYDDIVILGASIGANLALLEADKQERISKAVLLSPGLDYRGVAIDEIVPMVNTPFLMIVGERDEYSESSTRYLHSVNDFSTLRKLDGQSQHGTNILKLEGINEFILEYLE